MKSEKMTIQIKEGRSWTTTNIISDPVEVYRSLSHDMIAKKLHACSYIKRIEDRSNYDGTRTIKVTYDNSVRRVYVIEF